MMIDIAVVDYGMGNLRSVSKALEYVAPEQSIVVTGNPAEIAAARRVVFPGQGAMPDCRRELTARGLQDAIRQAALSKPFLGICIGLQLLFERSEEGDTAGLGILPGRVVKFERAAMRDAAGHRLKVPHMGWNQVYQSREHPLWQDIPTATRFYYVHSYYVIPEDEQQVAGYSEYPARFTSAVARDNIFAVQFHPEKSQHAGLQLLSNFSRWHGQT